MTFPVHIFGLHPHPVLEIIAYTSGFQLFLRLRKRDPATSAIPFDTTMWMIVGCAFGAVIGAKVLAWIESPQVYWQQRGNPAVWFGGKTIVGGLLGGWAGIEIAKKALHIHRPTGDPYTLPLMLGIAVGRIGCFLTGLDDHTYGNFTSLPWGVNFGDGPRHPTQLYESVFLLLLAVPLWLHWRRSHPPGELFRLFLLGYLAFRLAVEFIKPTYRPYLGLSAIQCACIAGLLACIISLGRLHRAT